MGLKLILTKDEKVLCEVPLSLDEWTREDLHNEFTQLQGELDEFAKVLDAIANLNRVRMVCHLLEDENCTSTFKAIMEELDMNPKLIREHAAKLQRASFLECPHRGKYRLSEMGRFGFMATALAMSRVLKTLKKECGA